MGTTIEGSQTKPIIEEIKLQEKNWCQDLEYQVKNETWKKKPTSGEMELVQFQQQSDMWSFNQNFVSAKLTSQIFSKIPKCLSPPNQVVLYRTFKPWHFLSYLARIYIPQSPTGSL